MKVFIRTFGCQMNVADSERMRGVLERAGYELAGDEGDADIVLLNTCSVRQLAEEKVWSKLGELYGKDNGRRILGVTGCMAQQYGERVFDRAPYVSLVCGTYRFHKIGELLEKVQEGRRVVDIECSENDLDTDVIVRRDGSISAFVPISRGCNNRCSYCVVPYVRGPERNRAVSEIADEVERLVQGGYKEVTLLGQNVNSYKDGECGFVDLLERLNKVKGIERIRFVTSHPKDASLGLFKAIGELDKVCESLHLPVQSGSDSILERMNRGYTRGHYLGLVRRLREVVPDVAISTDIIVGFPGETEEDFQCTYNLMKEVEFDSAFIFKYSTRPGTSASRFEDDVPLDVKRERNQCLLKLQDEIGLGKNKLLVGKMLEVLVEGISKNRLMGRTRTNRIVVVSGNEDLVGSLVNVGIVDMSPHTLFGRLV